MVERHGRTADCRGGGDSWNLNRGDRRGGREVVEKSRTAEGEW